MRPKSPSLFKLIKFGRTNLNTPGYWDKVWQSDSIPREYDELFALILENTPDGASVLDVGCGMGNLSKLLRNVRNARVTCLDFSAWACRQLEKQGFQIIVSKLPKIPQPNDTYDVAVATEVLEHLDNPGQTLLQMARVVRPGGLIMCSVPNDTLHPAEELEHQQRFTEKRLERMLSKFSDQIEIRTGKLLMDSDHHFLLGCAKVKQVPT